MRQVDLESLLTEFFLLLWRGTRVTAVQNSKRFKLHASDSRATLAVPSFRELGNPGRAVHRLRLLNDLKDARQEHRNRWRQNEEPQGQAV